VVGLLLRLAIALLAGHLCAAVRGRRFDWIPAGLVLIWLSRLGLTPLAFLGGLTWALGAAALFVAARKTQARGLWLACGACIGAGTWFRHDYLIWSGAMLAALTGAWWLGFHRRRLEPKWARALGWTSLAAAVTAAVCWAPVFARAGLARVADDLFFDQVRHVLPARLLPIPRLFALTAPGGELSLGVGLPAFLHSLAESAILVVLAGPLVFLACFALAGRFQLDRPLLLVLGAFSLAALPQTLGRTDMPHAVYSMVPALMLLWVAAEASAAQLPAKLAWAPLLGVLLFLSAAPRAVVRWRVRITPKVETMQNARGKGVVGSPFRDQLVETIQRHTRPGEPIFVGLTDHRTTLGNELDLYFLANRPGATRYMQFDPNIVNRREVQEEMIAELEAKQTRLVVLSPYFAGEGEPANQSSRRGADLLDTWLAANYRPLAKFGDWEVRLRNGAEEKP
jgi:hypothetical protein